MTTDSLISSTRHPKSKQAQRIKSYSFHCSRHPLGILPWGNYLLDSGNASLSPPCNQGLGPFGCFPEQLLIYFLELLSPHELSILAQVSKAFYCFTNYEELWKTWVLRHLKGDFDFTGCWKSTYMKGMQPSRITPPIPPNLHVDRLYSDVLHASWYCAAVDLEQLVQPQLERNIDRRSGLSVEEFRSSYEMPGKPVIITDIVPSWPAFKKWNASYLQELCGVEQRFQAEAVSMTLRNYFQYANKAMDETPIYLFDKSFTQNCPALEKDFSVPKYFQEDLFSTLGDSRPDFRWLIIGPKRSGSTFHIDPNRTSAWNAVLKGRKKWIMFPPEVIPPGVFPSQDGAVVTSPVSVVEWFLNFYEVSKRSPVKPVEFVCHPGELVFIPHGWWHLVVNLEDSIAITQNYVSQANLKQVLLFLRDKPEQVSGYGCEEDTSSLYEDFSARLQEHGIAISDLASKPCSVTEKVVEKINSSWEDAKDSGFKFCF